MGKVINPATGKVVREYPPHSCSEVEERVRRAEREFEGWRRRSFAERAGVLEAAADGLRQNVSQYAALMTEEMGKPLAEARAEVEKCAWVCEYYAEHAERFLARRPLELEEARGFVCFDPLGPVLAIMPWNFPFWQVFRFAAPALMAGNVGLLKHASNVPGCALAIEELFQQAGASEGVFTTLLVSSEEIAQLIQHPVIRATTLTGSERAGSAVASLAGKEIKKSVLELGGSDPFLVLADTCLQETAEQAVKSRMINSGQSCIAAKRFIVEREVLEPFVEEMTRRMEGLKVGDPTDMATDIGPLARQDLVETLHQQVIRSVEQGASLRMGGKPLEGEGFFYPPTLLCDVRPGMPAFDEETFGPVVAIVAAEDAAEAVQLANRSAYGLGASIWTRDTQRAEMLAAEIESGAVFINEFVKSDPRVPFGGVKKSGYGRELADFGIREFTNIKTVWIKRIDVVKEASEESFPASDPPSWTPVSSP